MFFIKIDLSYKDGDEISKQEFYHNIGIFVGNNRLIWGLYSREVLLMFSVATHIIGIFVYCSCS